MPLHVWVPDVYRGRAHPGDRVPLGRLEARGLRADDARARDLRATLSGLIADELTPFLALIAALTLFYGNLGALPQTNIKRLMGYSSIGQCGYILLGIAAAWETGISGALVYMAAYVVTNLAAFAVIIAVSRSTGSHEIEDYSGLARRNPLLGASLTVALLSLAGVPPFIGFFGKFMLVGSAFGRPSLRWLAVAGLINVVIALYYYLAVVKRIYMRDARSPATPAAANRMKVALVVSVALLILAGLAPGMIADGTAEIARGLGFPSLPPR